MNYLHLLLKAAAILAILLILKLAIDYLNLDVVAASPIITAFVAGVIFTIAIIFTGTLTDYKESEKIPGELVASVKTLYKDTRVVTSISNNGKIASTTQTDIKQLLSIIISNFRRNVWKLKEMNPVIDRIDENINNLAQNGLAPPLIVKFCNELTTVDRILYRVDAIMETTFVPAAYVITEIAIGMVIFVLLFVQIDPYYEGVMLFGTVSFLLISVLLLIKDMDNPFAGNVQIDLSSLYKLEEYLKDK